MPQGCVDSLHHVRRRTVLTMTSTLCSMSYAKIATLPVEYGESSAAATAPQLSRAADLGSAPCAGLYSSCTSWFLVADTERVNRGDTQLTSLLRTSQSSEVSAKLPAPTQRRKEGADCIRVAVIVYAVFATSKDGELTHFSFPSRIPPQTLSAQAE